ncbi:hypothetical protein WOB59_06940 [Methylocystis sp. IM4]|uniref:hypothetical protein n=1 Tax=Methylocystis sp. IM4 TaxID=3136560 RepID=UPI0031194926
MQKLTRQSAFLSGLFALAAAAAAGATPATTGAAASDLGLDNLVFSVGGVTYKIPHLELKGASLSALDLAQLFTGDEKAVDARLARLSAQRLVIPSLMTERKVADTTERAVYRDIAAEGIVAGRIATLKAGAAEQTVENPTGQGQRYVWGASLARGSNCASSPIWRWPRGATVRSRSSR